MEINNQIKKEYYSKFKQDQSRIQKKLMKQMIEQNLETFHYNNFRNQLILFPRLKLTNQQMIEDLHQQEITEILKRNKKVPQLDILKFNGVKSVENEGLNLQMNQIIQFPISQDIDVGMDTQIFQQNRFSNFYLSPVLGYNVDNKTRLDMKYTFGDSNRLHLQLSRVLTDSITYGFSYTNHLKRFKSKDDSFILFLQKHKIFNQNDRLFGHLSLSSSSHIGCEYRIVRNTFKIRVMNDIQINSNIVNMSGIRSKQECDLVYSIDKDHKVMAQISNSYQFRRVRLDLVKRFSDSFKTLIQVDNINSTNLVVYLGFKYRKTDLMVPIYWNQQGHVLQKDNWKVLGILAFTVSLFNNLHKVYKQRFNRNGQSGSNTGGNDKKQNDDEIPLSMKLKQIERRALENHNQQKLQNGLVVLEAYYGCKEILRELQKQSNKSQYLYRTRIMRSNRIQDVTMALRFWIYQGRLELLESSKQYLYGVGDGMDQSIESKGMLIRYVYQGMEYQELYDDKDKISIPKVN